MEKKYLLAFVLLILAVGVMVMVTGVGKELLIDPFQKGTMLQTVCAAWATQGCPTGDNGDKIPQEIKEAAGAIPNCEPNCGESKKLPCKCGSTKITSSSTEKYCCQSKDGGTAYAKPSDCGKNNCNDDIVAPGEVVSPIDIYQCYYVCWTSEGEGGTVRTMLKNNCNYNV